MNDHTSWTMRRLLETSAMPFGLAESAPRTAIFRQGDIAEDVLQIEEGSVLPAVSTRSGKEALCGVLPTGAFLGEEALLGHPVRRHSAIALTRTSLLVMARAHWLQLRPTEPAITDRFSSTSSRAKHILNRAAGAGRH